MSTRKRPRNNRSTSSSSTRSSGSTSSSSAMRRTTSLSDLAPPPEPGPLPTRAARAEAAAGMGTVWGAEQRRHSGDFLPETETAAFLKACGLCKRGLGPGRDTFIYMGEVAFCSHECRQQQMNLDELMEKKCSTPAGGGGGSGGSGQSGKSSTIAAA